MFKTKKIVFNSILVSLTLVAVMFVSSLTVFAASSSWGFTMNWDGYYVNGNDNGVYHTLSSGGVKISGTIKNTYSRPGPLGPYKIYMELYNKTSGNNFGCVSVTPTANGSKSFSGTYSSVGGGTTYYLVIYRTYPDGRTMQGSGTLSNI